ncbi:hypothetical protein N9B82_06760, partial [Saprospiraceae bacterium]|nr:hypothetical protein [Saprospiraceae bacterium]
LKETTDGLTTDGFDKLDKNTSYLYISNHRDIVLDTSLTNVVMYDKDLIMTSSAIGDNLVQQEFLLAFSKLSRNFLVKRSLTPREMLMSSINLSKYISHLLEDENRSIWLAQREGRTKDGNDITHQGILKMLTLGKERGTDNLEHLKTLKIVPLSISYEYDPTDYLKMPALLASYYDQEYVKTKNEDFNNIMTGVLGHKKRVHISAGDIINPEIDLIAQNAGSANEQLQQVAKCITEKIHQQYKLWPSNYIAHDMLYNTDEFSDKYTVAERNTFAKRVAKKTDIDNEIVIKKFLAMYAYPVLNKKGL